MEGYQELYQEAVRARGFSYSPYSNFAVGCAIQWRARRDGPADSVGFTKGANIENASYGAGICAERVAMSKYLTENDTKLNQRAIACIGIVGPQISLQECISPCGICRQFLQEFAPAETPVVMFNGDGSKHVTRTLGELLPLGFGPASLTS